MPFEKIADAPQVCLSPEHYPPSMIVLPPGTYRYTCPSCGHESKLVIYSTTCATPGSITNGF